MISEVVSQAVARAVTETLARPGPAAAADNRPLHELSNAELTDRIGEAVLGMRGPQRVAESASPVSAALRDLDLTREPLHELDNDSFMDLFGAAMVAAGEERLSSPLFGNAEPSPFMRGLR